MKNAVKSLFRREYTQVHALQDLSFRIDPGEIVGYIGPNGAGKSTTIKILCGILTPDEGECVVDGRIPWQDRRRHVANIGVVFGQRSQLWWDIPVGDSFDLLRDIYQVEEGQYQKIKSRLTEILQLEKLLLTPVRQLSLGQRMRCEIGAALLHSPRLLFLDEPTIGLDAVSKLAVRDFVKQINRESGVTVILTTHDMSDIEALTERVLLIGKGTVLLDSTLKKMREKYISSKYVALRGGVEEKASFAIPGTELLEKTQERVRLLVHLEQTSVAQVISACSEGMSISDVEISEESIDDVIVKLYKEMQL